MKKLFYLALILLLPCCQPADAWMMMGGGNAGGEECTWYTAWDPALSSDMGTSGPRNYRNVMDASTSNYSGSKIRVTVSAGAGSTWTFAGLSIGVMTTADDYDFAYDAENPGAPTRITFNTGSSGATVGAGASLLSDEITYTFTKTARHGLHLYMADKVHIKYVGSGSHGSYYNMTASDDTLTQTVSYTSEANPTYGIDLVEVCSP